MSVRQFIFYLFKKNRVNKIREENERLKTELQALEKLKKELRENHSKR